MQNFATKFYFERLKSIIDRSEIPVYISVDRYMQRKALFGNKLDDAIEQAVDYANNNGPFSELRISLANLPEKPCNSSDINYSIKFQVKNKYRLVAKIKLFS